MKIILGQYHGFYIFEGFFVGSCPPEFDDWRERIDWMETVIRSEDFGDVSIAICHDLMLVMRVKSIEASSSNASTSQTDFRELGKYADYANCISLFFENAFDQFCKDHKGFFPSEVNSRDLISVYQEEDKFRVVSHAPNGFAEKCVTLFRSRITYTEAQAIYGNHESYLLPNEVLDTFFEHCRGVLEDYRKVRLLSQIMKSLSEFRFGSRETSFILAWFSIEEMIQKQYDEWLEGKQIEYSDGSKRLNSDRKDLLTGRDYSVSTMTNILELSDVYSYELFKTINKARKIRNDIVHNQHRCKPEECQLVMSLAAQLIKLHYDVEIELDDRFPIYLW